MKSKATKKAIKPTTKKSKSPPYPKRKVSEWFHIGQVGVDSGTIWIK